MIIHRPRYNGRYRETRWRAVKGSGILYCDTLDTFNMMDGLMGCVNLFPVVVCLSSHPESM